MKVVTKKNMVKTLKKQGQFLAIIAMGLTLVSCNEEEEDCINPESPAVARGLDEEDEETQACSDSFLQDYQSMESQFKKLYSAQAGASELESFRSSLDQFIANHEDVECVDSNDKEYAPTAQVKAFSESIPKFFGASLASSNKSLSIKVVYGF